MSQIQYRPPKIHETCPTCDGKGKIRREECVKPNELVALIPYSDQRLKPRRTRLIIGASIALTLVVVFCIVFFIFPRPISLKVTGGDAFNVSVECFPSPLEKTIHYLNMSIQWDFHVHNPNYVPIHFSSTNLQMYTIYNSSIANATIPLGHVPAGKRKTFRFNVSATFSRDAAHIFQMACAKSTKPPYNEFAVNFVLTSMAHILTFADNINLDQFPRVHCPIPVTPIRPSNKTTTTPATAATTGTVTGSHATTAPASHAPFREQAQAEQSEHDGGDAGTATTAASSTSPAPLAEFLQRAEEFGDPHLKLRKLPCLSDYL